MLSVNSGDFITQEVLTDEDFNMLGKGPIMGLREREQEVVGPRAADLASKMAMVQWLKEEQHLVNFVSSIDDRLIDRFWDAYFGSIIFSILFFYFQLFSVNHYCLLKRSKIGGVSWSFKQ
ncbi:hypothetical protein [Litorimonas sp.]|uniref:hypothetical protein n=1 Tax=Litorimonas sp. TaxID=1892381 RepID=UPI003A85A749